MSSTSIDYMLRYCLQKQNSWASEVGKNIGGLATLLLDLQALLDHKQCITTHKPGDDKINISVGENIQKCLLTWAYVPWHMYIHTIFSAALRALIIHIISLWLKWYDSQFDYVLLACLEHDGFYK